MIANDPAFPPSLRLGPDCAGLSKREYAAIMAMQGAIAHYGVGTERATAAHTAIAALRHADELLAALGEG